MNIMILILLQTIALVSANNLLSAISDINIPEDGRLNFTELATKYGLKSEEVEVITEDGYMLTMFHVPGDKKPILILHGIGDSSVTWLLRGKKSLAVALAQRGYDLWFGNVRGNKYGRKHMHLNPDTDKAFWDFSFHEMGYYDWPAMINKVLEETKQAKLDAIGHSQGITSFFVLMSQRPEYNDKVNLCISLAPVTFLNHPGPALSAILKAGPIILPLLESLPTQELFTDHKKEKQLLKLFCSGSVISEEICGNGLYFPIFGYDTDGIEPDFFPVIIGQSSGVSVKSLSHYVQNALSGKFSYYDYGIYKNLNVYKSSMPTEYDLSKVKVNTAILYGKNDLLATEEDIQQWSKLLPNLVCLEAIEKKEWNHIDFLWSSEMEKYLFHHIFDLLQKYE